MTKSKPKYYVANIAKFNVSSKTLWRCKCGREHKAGSEYTQMVLCHCGDFMKKVGEDHSKKAPDAERLKETARKVRGLKDDQKTKS